MAFNLDFNIPTVMAIGGGLWAILKKMHSVAVDTQVRHIENTGQFKSINESLIEHKEDAIAIRAKQEELSRAISTVDRRVIQLEQYQHAKEDQRRGRERERGEE